LKLKDEVVFEYLKNIYQRIVYRDIINRYGGDYGKLFREYCRRDRGPRPEKFLDELGLNLIPINP
jgi:hypothetical protein